MIGHSSARRIERFHDIQTDAMGELLLSSFICAGVDSGRGDVVYVSTPITTGARTLEPADVALPYSGIRESQTSVIRSNIAGAQAVTRRARAAFPSDLVIEPTSLVDVPGYEQPDYHRLWCALIERHVDVVVFNEGWQFSTGCAAEFATAVLSRTRILDHSLAEISLAEARRLLGEAIVRLDESGRPTEIHELARSAVESLVSG